MNSQVNYTTLLIAVIAAVNGAAVSFGLYSLNSDQLDSVDKLVSLGVTIWGIWKNHK